jgi:AAA domain, putative AbiEii toxin, Type IV TA system
MEAVRLVNFRSLLDTGLIELKPITLLLGQNSSGKSSFIRSFPLLRQSLENRTNSPILWYGRYVDFGSLEQVANSAATEAGVSLEYKFSYKFPVKERYAVYFEIDHAFAPLSEFDFTVRVTATKRREINGSWISRCEVLLINHKIIISLQEDGTISSIDFDGNAIKYDHSIMKATDGSFLLPAIWPLKKETANPFGSFWIERFQAKHRLRPLFSEHIRALITNLFHGNTTQQKILGIAEKLQIGTFEQIREQLSGLNGVIKRGVLRLSDNQIKEIGVYVFLNSLPSLLDYADQNLAGFAAATRYMGPVRATAQRYYRAQDLAVGEVDFQGENVAMFIRSLSAHEKQSFSDFCRSCFNFTVNYNEIGGHGELTIVDSNHTGEINLADLGFGFSQLIPIVVQIWASHSAGRKRSPLVRLMALEQPELHLHPALQARLATLFVGTTIACREMKRDPVNLIIETHSESLVNKLGDFIGLGKISSADVQIVIFDRMSPSQTKIRIASYDDKGGLVNWPYGFFSPDT